MRKKLLVTTNGATFDETDSRCNIFCQSTVQAKSKWLHGSIIVVKCFDPTTGEVMAFHGVVDGGFYDYSIDEQEQIIKKIIEQGGEGYGLLRNLTNFMA